MDTKPLVTVILANYNYGKYINGAITSVFAQTYPKEKLSLVIVDDNSNDNSWELLLERFKPEQITNGDDKAVFKQLFTKLIDKVHVLCISLKQTNGPSFARNVAMQSAIKHTDIFAILDADDEFYPEKIDKCAAKIWANKDDIGVCYADYDILNVETGVTLREYKEPYDAIRLGEECIVHSGSLISKKAIVKTADEFGYYDTNMRTCEDYDLWIRISEKFMIVHIAEPLTLVRNHNQNSTSTVRREIWQQNWKRINVKKQIRSSRPSK